MTTNNEMGKPTAVPTSPKIKSDCPEGAGLIDHPAANETAHTPRQACAAPPSCATAQQVKESPLAQLAEGYKQFEHLLNLIRDDSYAACFQSLGQYRTALLQAAPGEVEDAPVDGLLPCPFCGAEPERVTFEEPCHESH